VKEKPRPVVTLAATLGPLLATSTTVFIFGSLLLVPTLLAALLTTGMLLYPRPLARAGLVLVVTTIIAAPAVLGALGLVEPSYAFHDGVMSVLPMMVRLPELATTLSLVLACVLTIGTLALSVTRIRDDLSNAERRLQLQAWQLRQLVST
jgi:hypothetical protein